MESMKWSCLLDDSIKERVIEQWLWNADIATEVSSGAADLNLIVRSIFGCLEEYPHSKEIQSRSYSLLLEAHTLSESSINVHDDGPRYTSIIESSLRNWTSHADIVSICLKYLAVASEILNGHTSDLLESIFLVLNTHCHSTRVQLPGIQILYNLLQHRAMKSIPVSEVIVRKIVGLMIYNLRFQNSDFSISKICCCALEIVVRNMLPQEIDIFSDDIVVLVSQVFHRYHRIPEISSVCLIIIEKLAVGEDHLLTFCSSSDQLFQICESLRGIKCSTKYSMSISAACQLLNRSITNKSILDFILGDDEESGLHFLSDLQTHLSEHLGDLNSLCCEWGLSSSQSCEIITSAVKVLSAVDDMLQSPSGRSKRVVTSGSRSEAARSNESEEDCTPDSNSVCISPGRNLLHLYGDHINDDVALVENSFTGSVTEGTGIVYEESSNMDDFLGQGVSKSFSSSSHPSEHEATMIIEVAQQSQHQAAVAMVRADILHKLFVDATKKMEVLIRESNELRTEIFSLKNNLSADSKEINTAEGEALSPSHLTEAIDSKADVATAAVRQKHVMELKKTELKCNVDRRGVMERAEDSISLSLESAPLSDSDSEGGHHGHRGTSYSSLSATQDCAPSSGGGARVGGGVGAGAGMGLAKNALNSSSSPSHSHPLSDLVEERTLSLAVAGIIEALSVLTCGNSAQTRYEAALTDKARRSLLQHGRGLIPPADWAKYEILGGSYYVGRDAISAVTIEELARVVLHVFRHLKEYEMTGTTGLLKQSAISLAALRIFLRDVPLFRMRDLDILIKRLGVAYMSISGFSYVFMALTIQRFHRLNFNELLLKSTELLKRYWIEVRMRQGGLMESGSKIRTEDELSRSDMSTLFLSFDKGRNALQSIYNSYLESPVYMPTGTKLDRTSRLQRMTTCPCKVGDEHAFVDSPSERVKLDPSAPQSTAQYGVSLRGVAQFAMDFDLHPTILSPSLLFRIFEDVLAPSALYTGSSDLDLSGISPVRTKGSCTDDTLWNLRVRGVQSPSTGKSAATCASKHGEPLLTLDQFQAVVVGVALKSSYIGYLASDVRHAEEISSPPMVRRLFIGRKEEGAPLKQAFKKENNTSRALFKMEDFQPTLQRTQILIRKNGSFIDSGKKHHWSFAEFLRIGSERLDLFPRAVRAFNIDGAEITDCMMIGDTDSMFLSGGEAFISPSPTAYTQDLAHKRDLNEHNRMPAYVGMYNVGAILGSGAFGEVRLGTNKLTDEKVALKFLRKSDIQTMGAAERTSNETQCLSALSHRNIIKLFTRLEIHKYVVMVFDLMEGGDMFRFLNKRGLSAADAALSDEEARHVFTQVLSGIDCAHKHRIIHRDLKLENLLLKDASLRTIKIADFGLSQFCRPGALIKGDGCGTLTSAAPELLSAKGCHAGPPIDVWAVGVVLYALLCGRLPFSGPNLTGDQPSPNQVRKSIVKGTYKIPDYVSGEAKDLIDRILTADPAERATVSQIFNHSWLHHRTDLGREVEFELSGLQLKMPTTPSNTEYSDLERAEHVFENSSRGARDRPPHRRHPTDDESPNIGRQRDRGESLLLSELDADSLTKSLFVPSSVSTPQASNPSSPMRGSHPALDCLTDELDKSIFDCRQSLTASSSISSDTSPSIFTARIQAVASKFGKSSLDRNIVSDCDSSGCDMKGWGAPRARNSVGLNTKSPTQGRVPTRNGSCDSAMYLMDAADEIGGPSTRRISGDSFKGSGKHSSFSFKYSPSTTISTSGTSTSTTSSSRNNSTRVAQLSPHAFSDELDKRLLGLAKRMS